MAGIPQNTFSIAKREDSDQTSSEAESGLDLCYLSRLFEILEHLPYVPLITVTSLHS